MMKENMPQTIEKCNVEMQRTQQKVRQYKNRNKMFDHILVIAKQKGRNHRLCLRGSYMESIVPELVDMTDEETKAFLKNGRMNGKLENHYVVMAHLYTLKGVCTLRGRLQRTVGGHAAQRRLHPLRRLHGYPCTPAEAGTTEREY